MLGFRYSVPEDTERLQGFTLRTDLEGDVFRKLPAGLVLSVV